MTSEDLAPSSESQAKEILRIAGQALKEDTVQIFELMYARLVREFGQEEAKRVWLAFRADMNAWEEKRAKEGRWFTPTEK